MSVVEPLVAQIKIQTQNKAERKAAPAAPTVIQIGVRNGRRRRFTGLLSISPIIATKVLPGACLSKLNIVVLAAGFSTRLRQPKALARIHGVSLLRSTLEMADALRAAAIVVVVPPACARYRREAGRAAVIWARNAQRSHGLSTSVRCGLRYSRYAAAALLLPVDLVRLELRELQSLVSRWRACRRRVFATRMTAGTAQHGGIPLILPVRFFSLARNLQGDVGLRALIAGVPAAERTLVDLPSAHTDVDTVHDLASARRRWS